MKFEFILGFIIVSVIGMGFVIGAVIPETPITCTEMACLCQEGGGGEIPCNGCVSSNYMFATGIVNVIQHCNAREFISCENNTMGESRIDLDNATCQLNSYFLGYKLNYEYTNSDEVISVDVN